MEIHTKSCDTCLGDPVALSHNTGYNGTRVMTMEQRKWWSLEVVEQVTGIRYGRVCIGMGIYI